MASGAVTRVIIVGGVAGGASAAARLRRLCEKCSITIFERGPFASFANCGLPYRVGNTISQDDKLLVATPALFKERFNIDVFTDHEVLRINREKKFVTVRPKGKSEFDAPYDKIILAPGAKPLRPELPGIELDGVYVLRNIPDMKKIMQHLDGNHDKSVVLVGGGFIGLELAEQLRQRGLKVTVLEKSSHVMPMLSDDLAHALQIHLRKHNVNLVLGDGVAGFQHAGGTSLTVLTEKEKELEADIVILGIGVVPETYIASDCGLKLGVRGSIVTDEHMRTNDENIFAVGDAVETYDFITKGRTNVPLAGPANRQGRVAGDVLAGKNSVFRGVQGTAVCEVFGLSIAISGASELSLQRAGISYATANIHPGNHVSYYPGAKQMHLKLFFDPQNGKIFGVQGIGEGEGVVRRVDVIAMAMQLNGTVADLAEAELCYSPSFGAAKDAVNMIGFVAQNAIDMHSPLGDWEKVPSPDFVPGSAAQECNILDVRTAAEYEAQHIPGAINIPLESLRERIKEVPTDKPLLVTCQAGQRGYYALRLLLHHRIDAKNLSGGMITYCMIHEMEVKRPK